jgi:CreA protein
VSKGIEMMLLETIGRRIASPMSWCRRDPTITEILSDSIVVAVMKADGVDPVALEAQLRRIAQDLAWPLFKWLTPNDKLATYGLDDPEVDGVACHFTVPERGGFKGWIGVAEEVSDISLSCSQVGPIVFKEKFEQGDDVFRKRRSLFFKKMQIVRGCDVKRNVLVYMVYSDRIIEGSPKNSTSSVPIMPWGGGAVAKCADWIEK